MFISLWYYGVYVQKHSCKNICLILLGYCVYNKI